jgi:hypothetical protein
MLNSDMEKKRIDEENIELTRFLTGDEAILPM